jgi:hypothetical protein
VKKVTNIALSVAFLLAIVGTCIGIFGFNGEEDNVALQAVEPYTTKMTSIAYFDDSTNTYYITDGTGYWKVPMVKMNGKWKAESVQQSNSLPESAVAGTSTN